ncbi:MAG: type II 3-dehydroquinate dehydratase [Parvibaculaceae bacterium]|nr:type II 3-dehydroquinate dehydratase [Parvibaculaceae bacterium]
MTKPIYVLNGPNLNLLGSREPEIYGKTTLADIEKMVADRAVTLGLETDFRQTNSEGELVTWIQEAREGSAGLILNAAAYSHTSIAIFDALSALDVPIMEVHLSNIFKREEFRHHSYVSPIAQGVICGLGAQGYELALDAIRGRLD